MTNDYNVIVERDVDGNYVASVPSLPGCHTQAKSLDTLMERIREAIVLHLEVYPGAITSRLELVGIQRVTVPVCLPRVTGAEVVRRLQRAGFVLVRMLDCELTREDFEALA